MIRLDEVRITAGGCTGFCDLTFAGTKGDPNEMQFTGTLLLLDTASDKPPHGSQGHRIFVPTAAAKKRMKSIIGKAINYAPDLEQHAPRRKVGVITGAWIDGKKFKVKGIVWKKDFPEAARDLKTAGLGMSMELASVLVRDQQADVWVLDDFYFSGATALKRKSAAYTNTALVAAAAALSASAGGNMAEKKKASKVAVDPQAFATAIGGAVTAALSPLVTELKAQGEKMTAMLGGFEEIKAAQQIQAATLEAAGEVEDDDTEDTADVAAADDTEDGVDASKDVKAGKGKKAVKAKDEEDKEDEEDESDDEEDEMDEDVEAALAKLGSKPKEESGELNKEVKVSGAATPSPVGAIAAAAETIKKLATRNRQLLKKVSASRKEIRAQTEQIEDLEAQVAKYADSVDRRSVPTDIANLLAKGGYDVADLRASGTKLTVHQVDQLFASAGIELDTVSRMTMKNKLLQAGMMDQGLVQGIAAQ